MPRVNVKKKILDARPDRLDLRDREYRPRLQSLPEQWPPAHQVDKLLPCYTDSGLILDQGEEGACTGFGLAAVINYLIWIAAIKEHGKIECLAQLKHERQVSPKMLYNMARLYDEWDGEDYEGSSCRGAMKGWHRHGVCTRHAWTNQDELNKDWSTQAACNPLGAYYRINKDSVVDMQSAIHEVGAIYCSANVHEGWWLRKGGKRLPIIKQSSPPTGGHAFALVGYNADGFIVQNSWGDNWGYKGFAVLSYADWVEHGTDSWVAARGAPVKNASPQTYSNHPLQAVAADNRRVTSNIKQALRYHYQNTEVRPWSEEEAYKHTLVIGNDGRPKRTMVTAENPDSSARLICYEFIRDWLQQNSASNKIAIYVHGGLNSEEDSINRTRIMAPYFKANGVYPLFVTWKTGFIETIQHQIQDHINSIFQQAGMDRSSTRATGIFDKLYEPIDRAIEAFSRHVLVRGLWSEMKKNARDANDRAVRGFPQRGHVRPGGMVILSEALKEIKESHPIEIHLLGHSAGSILLGYWLRELEKRKLNIDSATLLAPACTLEFANQYYGRAHEKDILDKQNLSIHMMDNERELADSVGGVYKKSLLYLVSRALEDIHKMPLLGMAAAWDKKSADQKDGVFNSAQKREIDQWVGFATGGSSKVNYRFHDRSKAVVKTSLQDDHIDLAHGSFDNDIIVIEQTLKQILGDEPLSFPIENLSGF